MPEEQLEKTDLAPTPPRETRAEKRAKTPPLAYTRYSQSRLEKKKRVETPLNNPHADEFPSYPTPPCRPAPHPAQPPRPRHASSNQALLSLLSRSSPLACPPTPASCLLETPAPLPSEEPPPPRACSVKNSKAVRSSPPCSQVSDPAVGQLGGPRRCAVCCSRHCLANSSSAWDTSSGHINTHGVGGPGRAGSVSDGWEHCLVLSTASIYVPGLRVKHMDWRSRLHLFVSPVSG